MNPLRVTGEKLDRALHAPGLDLIGAKGRYADLGYPHRERNERLNLRNLVGPFLDFPQIPVERKTVYRHRVNVVEHAAPFQVFNKTGIDR